MSKTFMDDADCFEEIESEAPAAEEMFVSYAAENSSVFRCVLKVVMVAELFVTKDREFQTAGAVILNVLHWKLILVG